MPLFSAEERRFVLTLTELSYCNPFLPERMQHERDALGSEFQELAVVWSRHGQWDHARPNLERLGVRAEELAAAARERLVQQTTFRKEDWKLYEDLATYVLYHRCRSPFSKCVGDYLLSGKEAQPAVLWKSFLSDYRHFLQMPHRDPPALREAAHLFACLFQIHRAFHSIYHSIVGESMPVARLRAEVWQSVFTHDLRHYRAALFDRLGDFTTLITGPTGTGKELVARAIGLSRYIPFEPDGQKFSDDFAGSFHALNLSALSPTLIESELFGHRRGAFTGATADRAGWLEICRPLGTVFLDEIGDLEPALQVKLLRVLQSRAFQRLGDTADRPFRGKIIAATHQDLAARIHEGSFREDFYYRLCSDLIHTPSLREQLADCPADLRTLVEFQLGRIIGRTDASRTDEVVAWIDHNLGPDYAWPGNVRELEQCVRNLVVRQHYQPRNARQSVRDLDIRSALAAGFLSGAFTADELLSRYCTLVYAETGTYEQTAQRLKLDRRTVKAKVDLQLLNQLR